MTKALWPGVRNLYGSGGAGGCYREMRPFEWHGVDSPTDDLRWIGRCSYCGRSTDRRVIGSCDGCGAPK